MALTAAWVWVTALAIAAPGETTGAVYQSARDIPIARRADVVVVGGTLGAVCAAIEAAAEGSSVVLVAPRTYVGDDIAGTLFLWLEHGESNEGALTS